MPNNLHRKRAPEVCADLWHPANKLASEPVCVLPRRVTQLHWWMGDGLFQKKQGRQMIKTIKLHIITIKLLTSLKICISLESSSPLGIPIPCRRLNCTLFLFLRHWPFVKARYPFGNAPHPCSLPAHGPIFAHPKSNLVGLGLGDTSLIIKLPVPVSCTSTLGYRLNCKDNMATEHPQCCGQGGAQRAKYTEDVGL